MVLTNSINNAKLTERSIHVWQASLEQPEVILRDFWQVLNQEEQQRANRFIQAKHRANFVVSRGILRALLASYLDCAPASLVFQQNAHGKLNLAAVAPNCALQFNISHSNDIAAYAFTLNKQIGIDVEYINRRIEILEIAKRFFSPVEITAFLLLPKRHQLTNFFNCWTRKEAFIKALGKGLSYPLDKFTVNFLETKGTTKMDISFADKQLNSTPWSLFNLSAPPSYCAALAIQGDFQAANITQHVYSAPQNLSSIRTK